MSKKSKEEDKKGDSVDQDEPDRVKINPNDFFNSELVTKKRKKLLEKKKF